MLVEISLCEITDALKEPFEGDLCEKLFDSTTSKVTGYRVTICIVLQQDCLWHSHGTHTHMDLFLILK